jgi:hypothetical protein
VRGQAFWNGAAYGLYYERSLGYIKLESTDRQAIEALALSLEPALTIGA